MEMATTGGWGFRALGLLWGGLSCENVYKMAKCFGELNTVSMISDTRQGVVVLVKTVTFQASHPTEEFSC